MNSDDKLISVGKLRDFWNAIKTKFATAAQGAKADTALQKTDIISGTLDGTISVDGTNVPVKGLGSAAYMIVGRNLGNVPMNGASLGTTANVPVVTNTRGQLAPHSSGALGTMAFKEASNYATKATTLSGYGITDAYTKTQSDTALTTHKTSGDHDGRYYTESEVDAKINALNSNIELINVESRERPGESADVMTSQANATAFFKINASSGTTANSFPVNSAGCLMVINLYGIHVIQVFFPLNNRIFIRHILNASTQGSAWTEWKEIS